MFGGAECGLLLKKDSEEILLDEPLLSSWREASRVAFLSSKASHMFFGTRRNKQGYAVANHTLGEPQILNNIFKMANI